MLFSSMTFIYVFMPIVCLSYLIIKPELKNYLLLIASILFYAWGEPRYLVIMFATILINYYGAILVNKYRKKSKCIVAATVLLDLAFLIYFKYFNFIIDNTNALLGSHFNFIDVVMPIGISFYTFQAMSYLIDVYRKDCPVQKDIYKLALYISLFPQLVAGPIVKYHDVAKQIDKRAVTFDKVNRGVQRFIIGLAKKMLIANTLGAVADKIFAQPVEHFDVFTAWLGAICYSLQLFYDFSGYSDMAIGLGLIFGFNFLENFNYPYIAKSITEFWRRWHISLSTWFKEYLYIPLGGNRCSKAKMYLNLFIVFLATGIWHGAEWTFVVWGIWHGFFIILEKATGWNKDKNGIIRPILQHIYTIFAFVIGWVLFRAENLTYACDYIKNMFGLIKEHDIAFDLPYYIDNGEIAAIIVGILCAMPIFKNMLVFKNKSKLYHGVINVWLIILFILSSAAVASSTYNPFIYFRF